MVIFKDKNWNLIEFLIFFNDFSWMNCIKYCKILPFSWYTSIVGYPWVIMSFSCSWPKGIWLVYLNPNNLEVCIVCYLLYPPPTTCYRGHTAIVFMWVCSVWNLVDKNEKKILLTITIINLHILKSFKSYHELFFKILSIIVGIQFKFFVQVNNRMQ